MTRMTRLILTALAAGLLALPAPANQLLNEDWIAKASYEQVQKAIAGGADPDAVHHRSFTPLMAAARHGNLLAMEALLDAGVDPNRPVARTGLVAMHFAATGKAVALLFDYGASVSIRSRKGHVPLHLVARDGTPEAVQALIRRGADVNTTSAAVGNTPLHDAARYGTASAVQILLDAGADINATNRSDVTPLHKAARHNIPEVVEVLLEAGADPTIHANNRYVSSMAASPAEAAMGNRKLRGHPVMARLEVGMTTAGDATPTPGCDGYVVQASDRRLGDVAENALGDRARWTEIARLNGITAEAPHRVGQCLALP